MAPWNDSSNQWQQTVNTQASPCSEQASDCAGKVLKLWISRGSIGNMSSPLSILGKNKRAPLPAGQKQAQRPGPFKEKPCAGSGLSDFELMSTMMEKIRLLEDKVQSQSKEIQSKEKKISALQEKLKLLQKPTEEPGASGRVEELEQTCDRLQSQVWEMERFLSDYGMVWVGSSGIPQEEVVAKQEMKHRSHLQQPEVSADRDFHMNFDLVVQSVRELNVLAGEGVSHVQATPGGARLAHRSPIPLSLFSNGIVMFDGPFRPYCEPSTQQCMLDLMDGYFPSELQERFPDGVPIQVNDRREEEFKERHVGAEFPGEGKAVGGATECSIDSNGHRPGEVWHNTNHGRGGKLSMEQFLSKLPKMVIKAGKVIDIRGSLQADMQSPPCSTTVIDSPALQDLRSPSDDVIVLKVRAEDGRSCFILRMLLSETVGQLRHYLDMHRGPGAGAYHIISTFPKCRYDDNSQTLQACGLTSNTNLLLRPHSDP